jgi:hypothetical protein
MAQDARNFQYSSDYQTPAFVYELEGSLVVGNYGYETQQIPHNLPFMPLIVGQWSLNPNFEPSFDIAITSGYIAGNSAYVAFESNSTDILVTMVNNEDRQVTLYYRIFGFAPDDYYGADVPNIEDSTNFKFNSDYVYPKLFMTGSGVTDANREVIVYHNLGYVPQVKVWQYDPYFGRQGQFVTVYYADGSNSSGVWVDEEKLIMRGTSQGNTMTYHIYADEV